MPAHSLDMQGFFNFVTACVLDPRFTPDNVIGRINEAGGKLGALDRWMFRTQVIPRTRVATLDLRSRVALLLDDRAARWGLGRVDTFNPYKAIQFNWRIGDLPANERIGAADWIPSLWNQKPREGMYLHWDGNNDSVDERSRRAGRGVTRQPHRPGLQRVKDWIWTAAAASLSTRSTRAWPRARGLYRDHCATMRITVTGLRRSELEGRSNREPIEKIGTDPFG
jgi:hypothetical protein